MQFKIPLACALLLVIGSASPATEIAPTIGFFHLDEERLTGETSVISNETSFSDLTVLVTIDTAGRVTAAEAVGNHQKLDVQPALALVRAWTFRPQTFEGRPVNAVGVVGIAYRKREIPPDAATIFPEGPVADTAITLHRGACFGSCPDYQVTVHGDGLVEFETANDHFKGGAAQAHLEYSGNNVLWPGRHVAHVDPAAVARLLDRFRAAHFFGLKSEYFYGATDNPTQVLSLRIGKHTKVVTDYIGTMAGMPQEVRDLEEAVDAVADTARWVSGNAQTLTELDAIHFDFQSHEAVKLTAAAIRKLGDDRAAEGAQRLLLGMVDRGVPLEAKLGEMTLGTALLRAAAMKGNEALFDKLVQRGSLESAGRAALTQAFVHLGCSSKIARALVKAGADPRATGEDGTALTALRGIVPTCGNHPEKLIEMADTLIELGVPLEARDGLGWTALMGCDSPELAKLLIARGADVQARDEEGTTALLSTDEDRVALILLRAGANPLVHDENGTVRAQVIKQHMPATLAWLDAHGIR